MSSNITIINSKINDSDQLYDITLSGKLIEAITPSATAASASRMSFNAVPAEPDTSSKVFDANAKIVLPSLIDMHCHIDKTYSGFDNKDGTLLGAIESMALYKRDRSVDQIKYNAERAIKTAIQCGVQRLRSHVDIGSAADVDAFAELLALSERYERAIKLEFTAMGALDTNTQKDLMKTTMALGATFVGGVPALSPNPHQAVENALTFAMEHNKGLDLHIDETESTEIVTLEILADLCLKHEFIHPVFASHCCSLAFLSNDRLKRIIEKLIEANISIVSLPTCNLFLQGRNMTPAPRGVTPIQKLISSGVNVCIGSDNVQDPFNPFGTYDLLQSLHIGCLASQLGKSEELSNATDLITKNPARALGISNYGLQVGASASLIITDADTLTQCVVQPPRRLANFFEGNLVYQQTIQETGGYV